MVKGERINEVSRTDAVYAAGLAAMLYRLLAGWRAAQRIVGQSRPVSASVRETSLIRSPFTIGVFTSRIILPATWKDWSHQKLRAVLAHERAHVRRRDPLVSLAAHVNRAIFWFHPLAWWLERKLATTAEHACDDAGIRAIGEGRKYAEVLLDLADTVRRSGGRVSWQGAGIDGAGLLAERIDRILRGDLPRRVSRTRKAMVALGCAAAILLAAACRRQTAVAPLQDDPKIAADHAGEQALLATVETLTTEQVAEMEAGLKRHPDDLDARKKLLIFYRRHGQAKLGELPTIQARRPHVLWFIEHHPEDRMAGSAETLLSPSQLDALPDPIGYAQARKAWTEQAGRPDATAKILANAAAFLGLTDKPMAEKLLLRARALEPQGRWSSSLGRLYYEALVGSNARMPMGVVRSVSLGDAHGAYANEVRRKLGESQDAELLSRVGDSLVTWGMQQYRAHHLDFDPMPLGKSYLERALQLDPQSIPAHQGMLRARVMERVEQRSQLLIPTPPGGLLPGARGGLVAVRPRPPEVKMEISPSAEQFISLARAAENMYNLGEHDEYYRHDPPAAKADWERAAQYARESLQMAPKFRANPDYGTAIFKANMTLGMVAMRNGKQKDAVRYMLDASRAPTSEELAYNMQFFTFKLPEVLLKYGERDSVIEFLERFAKVNISQKTYLLESANLIRNGKKPLWYRD